MRVWFVEELPAESNRSTTIGVRGESVEQDTEALVDSRPVVVALVEENP